MCESGSGHSHRPGAITDSTASAFASMLASEMEMGLGTPVVPLVCMSRPNPSPLDCLPLSISVITCAAPAVRHDGSRRSTGTASTPAAMHARRATAKSSPGGIASATRGAEIRTRDARSSSSSYVSDPCGVSTASMTSETSYGPPP